MSVVLLLLGSVCLALGKNLSVPEWKQCESITGVTRRLQALPGIGYDILTNKDMALAVDISYSRCKTTNDGHYLIPDNMHAIPLQRSQIRKYAEVIEHYSDYQSATAMSMGMSASFDVISFSFSDEYRQNKESQVFGRSVTTRNQLRHEFYLVEVLPNARLSTGLKSRLLNLASIYQSDNSREAEFQSDLIVRDYGTHFIRSVVAGGILVNEDQVSSDYSKQAQSSGSSIKASASESFFGSLGFNFQYSEASKSTQTYNDARVQSTLTTFGGPPYQVNFNLTDWQEGLPDALVSVDRRGDPFDYIVDADSLPEVPLPTLQQIVEGLNKAEDKYHKINTHQGCMNLDSPSFDYHANVPDNTCATNPNNYTLGGIYQQCSPDSTVTQDVCSAFTQKNPLTGDFSCPDGYESVFLHEGNAVVNYNQQVCQHPSHSCGFLGWSRCHTTVCATQVFAAVVTYKTYWCAAVGAVKANSGYLFGGLYTASTPNPLTQSRGCPKKFYPLRMGDTLSVCVSDDYELGYGSSLSLGGFYSCSMGNPLAVIKQQNSNRTGQAPMSLNKVGFGLLNGADSWPKACPHGHSQHLAAMDDNCEIYYCVKAHVFDRPPPLALKRPPYGASPPKLSNTSVLIDAISSPDGQTWIRNITTGKWSILPLNTVPDQLTTKAPMNISDSSASYDAFSASKATERDSTGNNQSKHSGLGAGVISVIAILCAVIVILFALLIRRKQRRQGTLGYAKIDGSN